MGTCFIKQKQNSLCFVFLGFFFHVLQVFIVCSIIQQCLGAVAG